MGQWDLQACPYQNVIERRGLLGVGDIPGSVGLVIVKYYCR